LNVFGAVDNYERVFLVVSKSVGKLDFTLTLSKSLGKPNRKR